jgi:hypothetical protein
MGSMHTYGDPERFADVPDTLATELQELDRHPEPISYIPLVLAGSVGNQRLFAAIGESGGGSVKTAALVAIPSCRASGTSPGTGSGPASKPFCGCNTVRRGCRAFAHHDEMGTAVPSAHYVGAYGDILGHDDGKTTLLRRTLYPDTHGDTPGHSDRETTLLRHSHSLIRIWLGTVTKPPGPFARHLISPLANTFLPCTTPGQSACGPVVLRLPRNGRPPSRGGRMSGFLSAVPGSVGCPKMPGYR